MNILISGASTGIGKAAAIQMAKKGHRVWAGVRSDDAVLEILRLNIDGLIPVPLDVTKPESIREVLALINKEGGILHALVNNAGIAVAGPLEGVTIEEWSQQFDVNVLGQVRMIQTFLPLLRESKGRIVNVSSIAGRVASAFMAPYASSKFALEALSDSLRRELKPLGISVSVIEPGPIDTPIWKKGLGEGQKRTQSMSAEVQTVYSLGMQRFFKRVDKARANAAPVSLVVDAIVHALTNKNPRTRYPVGKGISTTSLLARALPDRWMDYLSAL